jgi:hypothetical protein
MTEIEDILHVLLENLEVFDWSVDPQRKNELDLSKKAVGFSFSAAYRDRQFEQIRKKYLRLEGNTPHDERRDESRAIGPRSEQ